jgi:hypothetical protein
MEVESQVNINWIFYLNITGRLPRSYFTLDQNFRDMGISLIPITIEQLLTIGDDKTGSHIISVVGNIQEKLTFERKHKKLVRYLLRNNMIYFYQASSFSELNDTGHFRTASNYFFFKLPVEVERLTMNIVKYFHLKKQDRFKWPGGRSPSPRLGA